jgi:hypothetical protein
MIYSEILEGKSISSGDIIATVDGGEGSFYGALFKLIGAIIPGKPDHIIMYLGPDGICVEAGPKGVNLFGFFDGRWDAEQMRLQRGILDKLYGVGSLMEGRITDPLEEEAARSVIRSFLLNQIGKPYNWNFLDPDQKDSFYCSQLAYVAYKRIGINLDTISGPSLHPMIPNKIVTPEEVWKAVTKR